MKFTISTYDMKTYTSILWYIEKLKNTNKNYLYVGECVYHDIDENKLIDFLSYGDDFTFTYKDNELSLKRNRFGNPIFIGTRGEAGNYEEITLEFIRLSDLSDDDKIDMIKKLILESKEKYDENKRMKSTNEKMFLYSYAENYWENIKKIYKRDFDTVILDKSIKDEVKDCIDKYNNKDYKKRLRSLGINHKMNLVLSGLPGTGKSSLMFAIASLLDKDIATIDFNNKELNDHNFICALNKIPKNCIFVLEDIDALYIDRNKKEENRVSFSCVLNFLDGVYSKEDLVTIITTNHLDRIDKAIIRPMRIDKMIKFTYCSKYQYKEVFKKFFPDHIDLTYTIYNMIKNKKYTTSMLQKWFLTYLYEPEKLQDNVKLFEELIDQSSEKDSGMFT